MFQELVLGVVPPKGTLRRWRYIIAYGGGLEDYMGGCQNYGPFLDPYHNTAPHS